MDWSSVIDWLADNWVALVAALVATISLALQITRERRRRSTRTDVEIWSFLFTPEMNEAIKIKAINCSEHPIRIESAGFDLGSGRSLPIAPAPLGATISGIVAPHDSATTHLLVEHFPGSGLDPNDERLTAFVNTSDGERFLGSGGKGKRPRRT